MTGHDDQQHLAREGIQRVLYIAIGFAALIFGALHVGQITNQLGELNVAYGYFAVVVSVVMPTSLIVIARFAPSRFTHAYAKTTVILFAAAHAAWLLFMTVEYTAQTPWFQSINSIPAILAAVTWRHRWVWWYAFAQLPLVALTNHYSTGGAWREAVLSGVLSTMFSGIVIGVGLALVAAASTQDEVAAEARLRAAVEASARTREREQARINGVVRDEVMSALVVAGREPYGPRVAAHAEAALSRIASLTTVSEAQGEYSPVGAIAALRSAVDDAGGRVEFWHTNVARKPIPGEVVEALSEAVSEAVRNSIRHGGDEDGLVSRLVRVTMIDDVIQVRIEDSGRGFNPQAIPARRLGIRVSILKRMQSLDGGDAVIDSRPGRGTTVTLTWKRKS